MAAPRSARALASSSTSLFSRFAAAPRRCPQCLRTFASSTPYRHSSKRQLQTASAYHPSSIGSELPPRNFGVPNSSISSDDAAEVNKSKPQRWTPAPWEKPAQPERSAASISEGEAQKSQPAGPAKPLRPRRYNFGARKATIKITPSAVSHLRELLNQPEPKLIRIGTKAKGCSGLAYDLQYVDKPSPLDEQVEQDGVKVLIDNKALLNIIGSEMDWLEDKLNERFIFKNPNISKSNPEI
jgi:iron-sulfur cluster assembly protein